MYQRDAKGNIRKDKNGKPVVVYEKYNIKVFNTIDFAKSMHYNPFAYISERNREKDILKFVEVLIKNTSSSQQPSGDDFWVKAEKLLYSAYIAMMFAMSPEEEQNFETVKGYAEIHAGECVDLTMPNSTTRRGRKMAEKSNCLTTSCAFYEYLGKVSETENNVDGPVKICQLDECAVPIPIDTLNGKSHTIPATYAKTGENPFSSFGSEKNKQRIAIPVGCAQRGRYVDDNTTEQHIEIRSDGKSNCLTTVQKDSMVCAPVRVGQYGKGGQGQRIYSVRGKSVTLSANGGGQGAKTGLYKIDLPDGDYIIRKLTPIEAERLQTLPDNYTEGISSTQRYKCIGNGWTVDVIAHILGGLNDAGKRRMEVSCVHQDDECKPKDVKRYD